MKSKLSRGEIEQKVKEVFSKNPAPEQIKKVKKLAMSKNIKLGALKKKFCKKCYNLFDSKNSEIRIKKGFKTVKCKKCGNISGYRLK
jgi:RNase P subunit RPR2